MELTQTDLSLPHDYAVTAARHPLVKGGAICSHFVVLYLHKGDDRLLYRGIIEDNDPDTRKAQMAMLGASIVEAARLHCETGVVTHNWSAP